MDAAAAALVVAVDSSIGGRERAFDEDDDEGVSDRRTADDVSSTRGGDVQQLDKHTRYVANTSARLLECCSDSFSVVDTLHVQLMLATAAVSHLMLCFTQDFYSCRRPVLGRTLHQVPIAGTAVAMQL